MTRHLHTLLGLAASLLVPSAIFAQTSAGTISGLVTDTSGAVIPGVAVEVTDIDRNVTFETSTNEAGFYLVAPLPPGDYRITAESEGFRGYILEPFPIATQQKAGLDIELELGRVTESITVEGTAQLIEATNSTLSGVVENRQIMDLPLNGRNVYSLAVLTPGVFTRDPARGKFREGFHSIGIFQVNGGRDSSNMIMMDGVPVTMNSNTNNMNANSALPTIEGIEEFRIQTNSYSAEYGRSGGGVLTMTTKSGTNELHGTAFNFLRNNKMDSNNFFANRAGNDLGTFQRNEFGFSVGGPIIKNRTFFFEAYEGRRQRTQAVRLLTLPTALQRAGDFSETLNTSGEVRTIYDPFSTTPDPARSGEFFRTPFADNRIPDSMMDPVALATASYYGAEPNVPGQPFTGRNNFQFAGGRPNNSNRNVFKVDHMLGQDQRIFVRHTVLDVVSSAPELWEGPGCPDGGCFTNNEALNNGALSYTNTLTPTSLLSLRYGFARSILDRGSWFQDFSPSELGLPKNLENGADLLVFPEFNIAEMTAPGLRHHWNFRSANMSHTLNATYSRVIGSHVLKAGGEWRVNLINHMQASWQMFYRFTSGMTQGPDPRRVSANAGFGYASFLLGTGDSGRINNRIRPAFSSKSFGGYIQDDWKVSRKLTLNIGVRWDAETGLTERYDRFSIFDPDVRSPLADASGLDLRGGWRFPGVDLPTGGRNLRNPEWNNFAPRLGLAYQAFSGTVVRIGYGMFFAMAPWGANYYPTSPFATTTPWLASLDGVTPNNLLRDPMPDGVILPPGASGGMLAGNGLNANGPIPSLMRTPYNQQWNFTIAQQFGPRTAVEVAYAGNKGTHIPFRNGWQMDQLDPVHINPDSGILDLVDNPLHGLVPAGVMSRPRVQRGQLLTPYPQYPGAVASAPGWGNTSYHSLQAKFTKRFDGGGNAVVAYTFSKLISDGSDNAWTSALWRNYYCRRCDRSISPYDQRHRLITSYTYELPFGKGKRFGRGWTGPLNAILGQWQVNGIMTLNSGLPLRFSVPGNTSFSFGGRQYPDTTGQNAKIEHNNFDPTEQTWFDTDQFSIPERFTFGNLGRVHPNLRADFVESLDLSIFKSFQFGDRVTTQFRAEWFNSMNHPIFNNPGTQVGRGGFGRIASQANLPRQTQLALKIIF